MFKKKSLYLIPVLMLVSASVLGQTNETIKKPSTKPAPKPVTKPAPKPAKTDTISDCKMIEGTTVLSTLTEGAFKEVSVKLDRDDSYIKIGSRNYPFKIAEQKINKPGYDWKYFVKDIKSERHLLKVEKNNFYLLIEFEGEGSEIEGRCPGCLDRFEDSRAPDIQWKSPRQAKIKLKPVAYNNSITFQVEKVDLEGKFEISGMMDIIMPTLNILEVAIKKEVEKQMKKFLNEAAVKNSIAEAFKPTTNQFAFRKITEVYFLDGKLFCCGLKE